MLRIQHNAWIHLAATLLVGASGLIVKVSLPDWRWLIAAIVLVWVAETLNTAFEHLCDVVSPDFHHAVQKSKDIAAAAVLICHRSSLHRRGDVLASSPLMVHRTPAAPFVKNDIHSLPNAPSTPYKTAKYHPLTLAFSAVLTP